MVRLRSTKRGFRPIELEDHALHNTLEPLIKKKGVVQATAAVTTRERSKKRKLDDDEEYRDDSAKKSEPAMKKKAVAKVAAKTHLKSTKGKIGDDGDYRDQQKKLGPAIKKKAVAQVAAKARLLNTKGKAEDEEEYRRQQKKLEPLVKKKAVGEKAVGQKTVVQKAVVERASVQKAVVHKEDVQKAAVQRALLQPDKPVPRKKREKTWQDIEKEAVKASLAKGPIEPPCCKPHPVKYNHGHIQIENESGDEEEVETNFDRPRGRVSKNPNKKIPYHLQEAFAPVPSIEEHPKAAHFRNGWATVPFGKRSHIEKDATNAVANTLAAIHGNDSGYIQGAMTPDLTEFLMTSNKETLRIMADPKAQEKRESVREWKVEDKNDLEKLLDLVKEKLRLAEEKEAKEKADKDAVRGGKLVVIEDSLP